MATRMSRVKSAGDAQRKSKEDKEHHNFDTQHSADAALYLVEQTPTPPPDSHVRHLCCGVQIIRYCIGVAAAEFTIAILSIVGGFVAAFVALPDAQTVIVACTVMSAGLRLVLTAILCVGLALRKHMPLIPFLVGKCAEIVMAFIGLVVCFFGLFGYTTFLSMLASATQVPFDIEADVKADNHPIIEDYESQFGITPLPDQNNTALSTTIEEDTSLTQTTVTLMVLIAAMLCIISVSIWFHIAVFKCYRYLRDRTYYGVQTPNVHRTGGKKRMLLRYLPKKKPKKEDAIASEDDDTPTLYDNMLADIPHIDQ